MQKGPEVKTVDLANGETFTYREAGDSSKILLLVHGALGSSDVWSYIFPRFTDKFRVIAPDLRGHGQTTYNNKLRNHDDNAEDLKLFVDALGLKQFYLLGWSMGGGISMKFTAKYPEHVERLILHNSIGAQGFPYTKVAEGKPTERVTNEEDALKHPHTLFLASLREQKDVEKIRDTLLKSVFGGRNKPDNERLEIWVDAWLNCKAIYQLGHLGNVYNITNEHNGAVEGSNEISKIKCKTLILHGETDPVVPAKEAEKLKELLGDVAELKIFKESGHAVVEDYPEEFVQLVREFFQA